MPTDMQILAEQIRRNAEAAAERAAAEALRGAAVAEQFMQAKRMPLSDARTAALSAVAAAITSGTNIPAPAPEVVEEPGQEEEVELCDCAVCDGSHPMEDMATVLDSSGGVAYASEDCLNDTYEFRQPEYITRTEQRRGINYYHVDLLVFTEDTSATADYAQSNWYWSERADQWYTDYEYSPEAEAEENGDIHDYDADVLDIHGWPDATPRLGLCFGIELEMECGSGRGDLAEALGGRDGDGAKYILKSDGSLQNGIELVTGPYTLEYHQARFNWERLTDKIGDSASSYHTSTAGIHIHINRAAMSGLTLGKLLVFINDKANLAAIEGIAQRKANHWAQFHPKKVTDARYNDGDKYQSLNVRQRTVEMRIFKGNLNPKRILKNIEFAHAAVVYCAQASMQELGWQNFWDWLRKPANRKTYGNLIDFGHRLMRDELSTDTSEDK